VFLSISVISYIFRPFPTQFLCVSLKLFFQFLTIPIFFSLRFNRATKEAICKNRPCTCQHAICECDSAFAQRHLLVKTEFDRDYHPIFSSKPGGWIPENSCTKSAAPRNPAPPRCVAPISTLEHDGGNYEIYEENHDYSGKNLFFLCGKF